MTDAMPGSDQRRNEADREDIMREAVALHRRASVQVQGWDEPVVVGFKRTGAMSVYFDQDPVYQFDTEGRLRRAYRDGLLYRTQGTTLAELRRERSEEQTTLVRRDLDAQELCGFLDEMEKHLRHLHSQFESGLACTLEMIPADADVSAEITAALQLVLSQRARLAPAITTRRK